MNPDEVLERIVASDGDCLSTDTCFHCPFYIDCHMTLINSMGIYPTRAERVDKALSTLTNKILLDDTKSTAEFSTLKNK